MRPLLPVVLAAFALSGCFNELVLNPEPDESSVQRIPLSANVVVGKVTAHVNGASAVRFDPKPAILGYAEKRRTFERLTVEDPDVTLKISAAFTFGSKAVFTYAFKLRGELSSRGRLLREYTSDAEATGAAVRFSSSADLKPTNEALTQALDKLFGQIERDRDNILTLLGRGAPPVAAAPAPASAPAPVSDVDAPRYRRDERPDDFALVIGVEKYESLPSADFAEHDAAAVKRHLLALGYPERNVIYLTGAKASKTGIEKYVETWLPMNVREDSNVFVYFSGHGAPDAATGQAYLVPWDGDAKFLKNTGYPIKQLYANLNALKAKKVVLAMDSCFSGEGGRSVLAKGARPLVTKVDAGVDAGGKLVVLAAAGGDEITGADEAQGHGLFTYYLLKGLSEASGDSSVKRLYSYLLPKVQDAARRDGREQTPQLMPAGADARP